MATIKNEFDYIQEARSQLAEALVNKFGVREQDILNADGSIKSTGLWASNSDGSKNYLKRLHDWAVLVTATNVHTDASLTFKNDGSGDAADTTFNGSVARSISYNSIGAAASNHVHNNLIIKWDTGNTEGTNLFTYNGSTAKTINLNTPFSQLFTNFGNAATGFKSTNITATIGGTTKSFAVNWADYSGRSQTADKWTTARTLTIGSTGKSVNGSKNVSWTLAEIGASASSHTHSVQINGNTKTIAAPGGAAVDLGSYLPLTGGTMTGQIVGNNKGGNWIVGRTNAAIYQPRNAQGEWHPIVGFKTKTGSWEFGSVGQNDDATFSWGSDSDYNSGNNATTTVNLRNISGTIALTSEIPTVTNYYWANVPISATSSTDTSPMFRTVVSEGPITAKSGIQIGIIPNMGWYPSNLRMCSGPDGADSRGINIGSLLVSDTWTDSSNVPTNGIYSKGDIITPANIKAGTIITPGDDSVAIKPARNGYDKIGDENLKFWKIYSSYFYGNFVGTASNATTFASTSRSKFVYANGDLGTSDVTDSSSLTRTQFWRDNNRQRIGVFVSHYSSSNYGWDISAPYSKNGDFTGRIKENGIWGTEYTFLTDSNFKQIINNTRLREFWINGYNGTETSTNCPVLVMHWPDIKYLDIWLDSTGFHFGEHASYNNGADLHAKNYYADSDIRYKNVIKHFCIDLSSLAALPLFLYTWNDKQDDTIHIGSSAQAVEQVIPQLVTEDSTGFKSLNYSILGTVAGITACKELVSQKSEIEMLKEKVKQLEQQLKIYNN